MNNKQIQEKTIRIHGLIKKIYCRFHDPNLMPNSTQYTVDQLLQSSISIDEKALPQTTAGQIGRKRRTISLSSDDDVVEVPPENDCQRPTKKRSTKSANHCPRKHDEFIDQI